MPIVILSLAIMLFDQLTKFYIQKTMVLGMSVPVFADILHITYILNPGAAFGILENQRVFFIIIAFVMISTIIYMYPKIAVHCLVMRLGIGFLIGGAAGNVIDRIQTGYVVDFIDFRIWPIFNIADIAIVFGVGMIIYSMIFLSKAKDECNECK